MPAESILHRTERCYKVAGFVARHANSELSDAFPLGRHVTPGCTASEPRDPDDRQHETDEPGDDPDPRYEEEKHDPDHDECDSHADHESRVPVQLQAET